MAAYGAAAWSPSPPSTGSVLWLWMIDAPASMHATPSATISSAVVGTRALTRRGVPPFSAASMITRSLMLEIRWEHLANVRGLVLRDVLVDFQNDQLGEPAAHGLAQHPEYIGRRNHDQLFQLVFDPTRFQSRGDLASEFVRLLIARAVLCTQYVLVVRAAWSIAGQIAFVRASFRMHEIFEFFERTLRSGNGKEAGSRSICNDNPGLAHD